MKKKLKDTLGVALLGIDERSCKLLTLFFKGPCEGFANVVDETEASVDIIDTHFAHSGQLIETSLARTPQRAIIVLTSKTTGRIDRENLFYLDKPIKAEHMLAAIDWASDISRGKNRQKPYFPVPLSPFSRESNVELKPVFKAFNTENTTQQAPDIPADYHAEQPKLINSEEQWKTAKYRSAITVEESDFNDFIGIFPDFDLNDANEHALAFYDTKNYYQGYVQYAYQVSLAKMQTLQLNSSIWKPLVMLPLSHEIWIDADDVLLKQIAGSWLDMDSMDVSPVEQEMVLKTYGLEKIQAINTFLWKLALFTSKGRYPKTIDAVSPVYLKQWPDLTRYIVTPHALRIAGLLVGRGPETMINVACLLNIELRYVYIFISAAHAIGLAGQAKRQVDSLIQTTLPVTQPAKKGLLNRIIGTLHEK
jgi:hypothetical protein